MASWTLKLRIKRGCCNPICWLACLWACLRGQQLFQWDTKKTGFHFVYLFLNHTHLVVSLDTAIQLDADCFLATPRPLVGYGATRRRMRVSSLFSPGSFRLGDEHHFGDGAVRGFSRGTNPPFQGSESFQAIPKPRGDKPV